MKNELRRESAVILAFPSRAEINARRFARDVRAIVENDHAPCVDTGSGWYHDDAMRDEGGKRHN